MFVLLFCPLLHFLSYLVHLSFFHPFPCATITTSLPAPLRLYDFLVNAIFLVRPPYCLYSFCASSCASSLPAQVPCATSLLLPFPWSFFLSSTISLVRLLCFTILLLCLACPFRCFVISGAFHWMRINISFFLPQVWVFCAFVIWACLPIWLIVADYHLCKLDILSMYFELPYLSLQRFLYFSFIIPFSWNYPLDYLNRHTYPVKFSALPTVQVGQLFHAPRVVPFLIWVCVLSQCSAHYHLCKLEISFLAVSCMIRTSVLWHLSSAYNQLC